MKRLQTHLYPGLIPSASATARTRHRTVHFRQGELDGAMLACSVFSALALMRLASVSDLRTLSGPMGSPLKEEFARSPDLFFHGAFDEDLAALLDVFEGMIRYEACTGSMRVVRKFALERLANDQLVILQLGVEPTRGDPGRMTGSYWVLAVGTEVVVESKAPVVTSILCLDPDEPPPVIAPFNARLDLQSPSGAARYQHYRTPTKRLWPMTCVSAFALSRIGGRRTGQGPAIRAGPPEAQSPDAGCSGSTRSSDAARSR